MNQRTDMNTNGYEVFTIGGYFTTDGSGDPTLIASTGGAFSSITKAATGTYAVALTDRWAQLYSIAPSFKGGTPATCEVHIDDQDVDHATTPNVVIKVIDHADGVDAAADLVSGEIYLTLVVGRRAI